MKYDVFGIGNALMDFLIQVHPNELVDLDLNKGEVHFVDKSHSDKILDKLKHYDMKIAPGGSIANALYGVALIGGNVVFCGTVGKDEHGAIYEQKLTSPNLKAALRAVDTHKTGHAITFITPDAERTFAVHLGASVEIEKEHVFFDDLKNSKIIHVEGYQLGQENVRDVCIHAMEFAKNNGIKVSIDVNDPAIIKNHDEIIKRVVKRYADIVFANKEEALLMFGNDLDESIGELSKISDIVVVKLGKEGSIVRNKEKIYNIKPHSRKAIDTTGAGDMYAAGFLYGISKGYTLDQCGNIASYLAAEVVTKVGARLDNIDKDIIEKIKEGE